MILKATSKANGTSVIAVAKKAKAAKAVSAIVVEVPNSTATAITENLAPDDNPTEANVVGNCSVNSTREVAAETGAVAEGSSGAFTQSCQTPTEDDATTNAADKDSSESSVSEAICPNNVTPITYSN
jgi:hypothetical protein